MTSISFWTPVSFERAPANSCSQILIEYTDEYFYFGGPKAFVVPGKEQYRTQRVTLIQQEPPSPLISAAKITSFFTGIIPLTILAIKFSLRYTHSFHLISPLELNSHFSQAQDLEVGRISNQTKKNLPIAISKLVRRKSTSNKPLTLEQASKKINLWS
jgi:hypothetical protein